MRTVVAVAAAGAVGALARWGIGSWFGQRFPDFPWGTLVVNVSGSFLLGLLFVLLTERTSTSPELRLALTTGLMGAYTTFSTFSLETFRLAEDGAFVAAAANIAGNLVLGLLGVALGVALARSL
jgi:CrcB protein